MTDPASGVAVIIVNWNAGVLLKKCLEALGRQTLRPARVIVVDNASSDGSADNLEAILPGVEVARLPENIGFAAANNLAAKSAGDVEWLALLNPDAFPEPDWLLNLLRAAAKFREFSFFASKTLNAGDTSMLDGTGDLYHVSGRVWRRDFNKPATQGASEDGEVFSACAAAALYKTSDFIAAGGFDESYFCYMEDVDLGFRLRLNGRRCMYVDNAVVAHVGSATSARHSDFYIYHGHRNLVWTFFKNMPMPMLLLYLPQHLLLNFVAIIAYSLKGRARVIARAKRDAILGLPAILRKRRGVQKKRTAGSASIRRAMQKGLLKPYKTNI